MSISDYATAVNTDNIYVMEVYLDYAATTPVKALAIEALVKTSGLLGNPSGSHRLARRAKDLLEESRDTIAQRLGVDARNIIFTSGGTEADNLAISGSLSSGRFAVCTAIEHHGVLEPVERTGGSLIGVTSDGVIDLSQLETFLEVNGTNVAVVSVMYVNNETGVVQPISEVSRLVRRFAPHALLHSDAVQAPNYLDLKLLIASADMVSISAHKFGGPKGVGILVSKKPEALHPIIFGGGQEWELRSGTQNVSGIAAMTAAFVDAVDNVENNVQKVSVLTGQLRKGLSDRFNHLVPNGSKAEQMCNITNYCFEGLNSEEILFLLDSKGIYASAGSSCASGALNPSHVLLAMGKSKDQAKGSLRLSLGIETTSEEVEFAVNAIGDVITELSKGRGN